MAAQASPADADGGAARNAASSGAGGAVDSFEEALVLEPVLFAKNPRLFLARAEFTIRAPLTVAYLQNQFDLFPGTLGKLLTSHRSIEAFEAALTQGRWKPEEWGEAPRHFHPPGALLISATNVTRVSDPKAVASAWKFLVSALSGALCASFEGMDPDHASSRWVHPLVYPWDEPGRQLQFSNLPYEPVCTENLTPWGKLLPCGRQRGLAALLGPLAVAASPLKTLSLSVAVRSGDAAGPPATLLRAALELVLPWDPNLPGFAAWSLQRRFSKCPAADRSLVLFRIPSRAKAPDAVKSLVDATGAEGAVLLRRGEPDGSSLISVPSHVVGRVNTGPAMQELVRQLEMSTPRPWESPRGRSNFSTGLVVLRDMLSKEGRSERTHGQYLLRLINEGAERRVRMMDQLPFFIRPLWHTFTLTLTTPGKPEVQLFGREGLAEIALSMAPSSGTRLPTDIFFTVDVPRGAAVSLSLDVEKAFIRLSEFAYSSEKGFDLSSAAWLELDLSHVDPDPAAGGIEGWIGRIGSEEPRAVGEGASGEPRRAPPGWEGPHFTEGLLVLIPMPDFSMPFNVIALGATAVTFSFGSLFRHFSAERKGHWASEKSGQGAARAARTLRSLMLAALVACGALFATEEAKIKDLRRSVPPTVALNLSPLFDALETGKTAVDDTCGKIFR